MSTTVAQVQSIAVEFASTDDTTIETFIDLAAEYVSENFWGTKYDYIHALMTAHMMKQLGASGSGSSSGPTSSERLGDISVSYAVNAVDMESLASTSYGAMISQLIKTQLRTPIGY